MAHLMVDPRIPTTPRGTIITVIDRVEHHVPVETDDHLRHVHARRHRRFHLRGPILLAVSQQPA
jgi:hypothetical protein